MRKTFYLFVTLLIISCNSKKQKLDELFAKQKEVKAQRDSAKNSFYNFLNSTSDSLRALDTSLSKKSYKLANEADKFEMQLKAIQFSIDSLSKY